MKVLVLGAGVIGVTTAYRLLQDGHEVEVVERHADCAAETSFANAGLVAPGHSYAWASPRALRILIRSLYKKDQALRFRPSADPRLWTWSLAFLAQCTDERARINTRRKHRLCLYSQQAFHETLRETGVAYDGRDGGLLYLYRSPANFEAAVAHMKVLAEDGQELRPVDAAEAARLDPALAPVQHRFAGAIYCPSDESGDARLFTQALAEVCVTRGARFRFGTTVQGFTLAGDRVEAAVTDKGTLGADAYVLALGCQSPFLARPLGVRLPIYPIKGYSVTLPTAGRNGTPTLGGVDEDNLLAYAPMGERLRITATAEFAGYDTRHRPENFTGMLAAARDLFPEACDYERPSYWAGLRPMTPQGTPIFGLGRQRNLYFNTGHGHMGWTMACGAARVTADLIAGRKPEIDLAGMTLAPH